MTEVSTDVHRGRLGGGAGRRDLGRPLPWPPDLGQLGGSIQPGHWVQAPRDGLAAHSPRSPCMLASAGRQGEVLLPGRPLRRLCPDPFRCSGSRSCVSSLGSLKGLRTPARLQGPGAASGTPGSVPEEAYGCVCCSRGPTVGCVSMSRFVFVMVALHNHAHTW